jgi:hypothetical protein
VEKLSFFVTAFKDLYVSQVLFLAKNSPIVIPQAAHQALSICFHVEFLRFTPQLCDYSRSPSTWYLQFSSFSHLGASTRKWCSWFILGDVGFYYFSRTDAFPISKKLLASPAMMLVGLLSIKPDAGHTKSFPACFF